MMKGLIDPRIEAIRDRFSRIRYTVIVASGKGGVGKSLIAATLSLLIAQKKYSVGLLDLDLHGPVTPLIFDLEQAEPEESKEGLIPPIKHGVKVMSLGLLAKNRPTPIHGSNKRDAIREILAVTRWDKLDLLVVDLPPGTGDEVLETLNLIKDFKRGAIVVTIPSQLSLKVVARLVDLLKEMKTDIIGLVENMAYMKLDEQILYPMGKPRGIELAKERNIPYLGQIPLDPKVQEALEGRDIDLLLDTEFSKTVEEVIVKPVLGMIK